MKYIALSLILQTALIGGLAHFEINARDKAHIFINSSNNDDYVPPNNGNPETGKGTGTRIKDCRGGGRRDGCSVS
ncbi:hypothetical protein [Nostoc sp. FACHB-110]|uniref:hypothetical protein n=1 Tax=Nostoc sp. FACHB-110 TaxID=2692834 RepID=UPI001686EE6B|nr:hypothetical protein [Nostoc sp. FACHB-110]MBD2437399.1 hypothetical protein [Nostoc sp. FACHB-110]